LFFLPAFDSHTNQRVELRVQQLSEKSCDICDVKKGFRLKVLFLLTFLICSGLHSLQAQDLVVLINGDSVQCKITRTGNFYIYFDVTENGKINHVIKSNSDIRNYEKNYFNRDPDNTVHEKNTNIPVAAPRFKLGGFGGFSFLTGPVDRSSGPVWEEQSDALRNGRHWGIRSVYFPMKNFGFGLMISNFHSANKIEDISVQYQNGMTAVGELNGTVSSMYLAGSGMARLDMGKGRSFLNLGLDLGYLNYTEEEQIVNAFARIKGKTYGMSFEAGIDYLFEENFAIGFNIAAIAGSLTEYEYFDGFHTSKITLSGGNFFDISRIDISVTLSLMIGN